MNQTSTPDTQISITIIPQGGVTDAMAMSATKITGKIPAGTGAEEVRRDVLGALPQFEETNRTNTNDTQICISIIQRIPIQGIVTDPPVRPIPIVMGAITGKISAAVDAKEVRETLLDALQRSYDFEETEGTDLSIS